MPSRMMFVLKAPARPRSPVISTTPTRLTSLALDQHRHARDAARLLGGAPRQLAHPLRIGAQLLRSAARRGAAAPPATISIARVILLMFLIDAMRLLTSFWVAMV